MTNPNLYTGERKNPWERDEQPSHAEICSECLTDEQIFEAIQQTQIELGQLTLLAIERGIGEIR